MWKRRFGFRGKGAFGPGVLLGVGEVERKRHSPGPGRLHVSSLALLSVSSSCQIMSKPASSASGLQISFLPWPLTSILLVNLLIQTPPSILHLATQAFLRQICP